MKNQKEYKITHYVTGYFIKNEEEEIVKELLNFTHCLYATSTKQYFLPINFFRL